MAFEDSMFEVIDVWTEGTDEEEYAALTWKLIGTVFSGTDPIDHKFLDGSAASKANVEGVGFGDPRDVALLEEGSVPKLIAEYRARFPPSGHESRTKELRRGTYSAGRC